MNIYKSTTTLEDRQNMQTPPGIAEWCAKRYGCNVDLAASKENKKFYRYFSDEIGDHDAGFHGNALRTPWAGSGIGFCNPPYGDIAPWIYKAGEEARLGFTSVFLIPTFNGDEWGGAVWTRAREIVFIEGRINFIKPSTGLPLKGNGRGSMLAIFGPHMHAFPVFSYTHRNCLKA